MTVPGLMIPPDVVPRLRLTPFELARRYLDLGVAEIAGQTDNARIIAMLQRRFGAGKGPADDETPWCAAFVGEIAWLCGLPEPETLWLRARSWLTVGRPTELRDAVPGWDVVILNRGGPADPSVINAPGHVGFYVGHAAPHVRLLGGNQGNRVSIAPYLIDSILGIRRWTPPAAGL